MARIKSAIEIALEKSEGIKADKDTLSAHTYKNEGKKLASDFLNPEGREAQDPKEAFKKYGDKERAWVQEGFFSVCLANLALPPDGGYETKLERLSSALQILIKDKKNLTYLFKQLGQFFGQYISTQEQVTKNLEARFEPQLRAREQQLSQQMGTPVRLQASQVPEFAALLKKNLAGLDTQYRDVLGQAKEELTRMFEEGR